MQQNSHKPEQVWIQFRDDDMRLLSFFQIQNIDNQLKDYELEHLKDNIHKLIHQALPGKLYFINTSQHHEPTI